MCTCLYIEDETASRRHERLISEAGKAPTMTSKSFLLMTAIQKPPVK
jgi:hypothetical protein